MLRKYQKGIALFLLFVFGQEIFGPGTLLALTGGPSQPEVNSFEPVGTNQMVDLATGDFNYNIPLMVVPGPNGGYPINLAYHAGIGMEQEASWVGLGWNINPGAITRNLRGVPDDFSGDEIVKKTNLKTDVTAGVSFNLDQIQGSEEEYENFGYKPKEAIVESTSLKVYFNNYRGVGYTISSSNSHAIDKQFRVGDKYDAFFRIGTVLSFDSNSGLGIDLTPNLGNTSKSNDKNWKLFDYSVGVGLNTKQGLSGIRLGNTISNGHSSNNTQITTFSSGSNITFANQTYVPSTNMNMTGTNILAGLTITDKDILKKLDKSKTIRGEFSSNKLERNKLTYAAYGTAHLQEDVTSEPGKTYNTITDVNVNNDIPINKRSVYMGFPQMTSDIYSFTGQGTGGSFRMHRNDIASLYESGNTSNSLQVNGAIEFGAGSRGPNLLEFFAGYTLVTLTSFGADAALGYHHSYSGKWANNAFDNLDGFEFEEQTPRRPLYEPFYFKVVGEKTASPLNEWHYMLQEEPVAFDMYIDWTGLTPKPTTSGRVANKSFVLTNRNIEERNKRVQNIEYKSKGEIVNHVNYSERPKHLFESGQIPTIHIGEQINYDIIDGTDANVDHHINVYSILRPDGSRYTYGLPAYNTYREDNVFANVSGPTEFGIAQYADGDMVSYSEEDANITNDEGVDHYYSSTEMPAYAHSNMLTEITSADYIDLTGDGVSEDDFGFYAKFNYSEVSDYKWRDPFYNANYIKGNYSNELDDKASFTYGSKNLFYVHSIETKTHVAVFELEDRIDGIGANDEENFGRDQKVGDPLNGQKQKFLKSITLYSKRDLNENGLSGATPLQKISFEYSYELCSGVFNNDTDLTFDHDNDPETAEINEGGKLTLKKVFITYNGNDKGRLSPYEFDYGFNPDYSRTNIDRWGNYQQAVGDNPFENVVNPYTRQIAEDADVNAGAWCMNRIGLPSGGEINVNFESDTYGYVQDAPAAQMVEILGFTDVDQDYWSESDNTPKLKKKNRRLWFKADQLDGVPSENRDLFISNYSKDLNEIYFKVYQNLKAPYDLSDDMVQDYVVGYAELDIEGETGADAVGGNFGYIDLKPVEYKTTSSYPYFTHPFRKAGWQYLRYSRPDLFNDQVAYDDFADGAGSALLSIPLTLSVMVKEALSIILKGEYNQYALLGYCKSINYDKKSFVRLNSPNKEKIGGGHRVSSIELNDNWIEGKRTFGTTYEYLNKQNRTSGVADYEPIVGGDENALKKPLRFNGNGQLINFQHQDVYIETPISEAVYPGARVVYGRVITKVKDNSDEEFKVNNAQSSISVNEYYTAKDFPVKTSHTELEKTTGFTVPIYIPFMGFQSVNNRGYSQGYSVVLNDMSGKLKSAATYPYRSGEIEGLPVSEVKYRYRTNDDGTLDNQVKVLDKHGDIRNAIMGVEQDLTIFEEENSGYSESLGAEFNLSNSTHVHPTPALTLVNVFFGLKFNASHATSMYRGLSTSKIIHKTGILEEVEVFSDGSRVVTRNELYDAETGEALLTTVGNEWDKPVYNYNYAAHWNYPEMGGAYQNYRAKVLIFGGLPGQQYLKVSNGGVTLDHQGILQIGDEITVNDAGEFKTYFVTKFSDSGTFFTIENANGVSIDANGDSDSGIEGYISRSSRRNLQLAKSGTIVALSDNFLYAEGGLSPQFVAWNNDITGSGEIFENPELYNCETEEYSEFGIVINESQYDNHQIQFTKLNCNSLLTFEQGPGITTPMDDGRIAPEIIGGATVYTTQLHKFKIISEIKNEDGYVESVEVLYTPLNIVYNANWSIIDGEGIGCWDPCRVADILHSDAIVYSDEWEYPYSDLDDPEVEGGLNISNLSINEFRYGKRGIWKAKRTYLYQIPRKQTTDIAGTKIDVDGEYQPWEPYSWVPTHLNPKWDWVSEITMYSPYGYAIEEKSRLSYDEDALGTVDEETAIYSCQMYGYGNSVVTAVSALSTYFEIGFTGFEQLSEGVYTDENFNQGHIKLAETNFEITKNSHTGKNALKLDDAESVSFVMNDYSAVEQELMGIPNKKYLVSLWVNIEENGSVGTLSIGSESVTTDDLRETIDGWVKLEISFDMGASDLTISYTSLGETHIDDLRVGPYEGGMMTYVYDPINLWLVAELDGLNYATFYNYDSEGNLIQVKKETEEGIVTVKTARSNTRQTP